MWRTGNWLSWRSHNLGDEVYWSIVVRARTKLPGYDPGTKRKPVSHQSLPEDAYVQWQMLEIISAQIDRFVRKSAKTQPSAVSPPQIVVADPTTEAAQQIAVFARRGDIAAATDTIIEAEASMALILLAAPLPRSAGTARYTAKPTRC